MDKFSQWRFSQDITQFIGSQGAGGRVRRCEEAQICRRASLAKEPSKGRSRVAIV